MSSTRKASHLVPRLVLSASFMGVVPACAIAGCGGTETSDGGSDAKPLDGVAAEAFGVAQDAFVVACCFGVADAGFVDAKTTDADAGDVEGG